MVWIGSRDYSSTSQYLKANNLWQNFMSAALAGTPIQSFTDAGTPTYTNLSETMPTQPQTTTTQTDTTQNGTQTGDNAATETANQATDANNATEQQAQG